MPPRRAERPDNDDMVDDNALHASDDQLQGFGGGKRVVVLESDLTRLQDDLAMLQSELDNRPVSSIIPVDGIIHAGRFELSMTGMFAPEDVTEKELSLFTGFLRAVVKAYQLWAGDLGNIYYARYGVLHVELAALLRVEPDTLDKWMRVCEKIPARMRVQELDYTHHLVVANNADKLGDRIQSVLEYAQKYDLSERELKVYIRELLTGKKLVRRISQDTLFSKDRTPGLTIMRKTYAAARKGDKSALNEMRVHLQAHRDWLKEVEQSLGLK
jgi:hypothetical protein